MSGGSRALARRYARALLDVAERQGMDAALALRDELRALAAIVSGQAELQRVLRHPRLGGERRRRLVAAVAEKAGATPLLRRLVDVLAARDRVALLPEVAEAYAEAANAAHGVVTAEAITAVPLTDGQRRALAVALGEVVELRTRVEPAVVGGALVRVGGRTYDGTVQTRLASLRRRLGGAGTAPPDGTR